MAVPNDIIIKDPNVLGGTPVFRGTRVPFQALLDYLEGGQTLDEFLDDFPTVTANCDEAAARRVRAQKIQRQISRTRLSNRPRGRFGWKQEWGTIGPWRNGPDSRYL